MKYLLSILVIVIFSLSNLFAQSCLPNGIKFSKQKDIDDFVVNYPGCKVIKGSVKIYDWVGDEIINLNGLSVIDSIYGDLSIDKSYKLTSLDGIDNLDYIGGDLIIENNYGLIDISGFDNLSVIGGNLSLGKNNKLVEISGFSSLDSLGGHLLIEFNDILTNLSGFDNLKYIGNYLEIRTNQKLIEFSTFDHLEFIGGNLHILYNPIRIIPKFEELKYIGESFKFHDNRYITDFSGFNNLDSIGIGIEIIDNDRLSIFSGFDKLKLIGEHLEISENKGLVTIASFESLVSIGIDLNINNNKLLDSITHFTNLKYIGSNLIVKDNALLKSFTGFNKLDFIGEYLKVENNKSLTNFNGFNSIQKIDNLKIRNNEKIEKFSGFNNLKTIKKDCEIIYNKSLQVLPDLSNLQYVRGNLEITNNTKLVDLNGFNNLKTINGKLIISNNKNLEKISSFTNLKQIGDYLYLGSNPSLLIISNFNNLHSIVNSISISENDNLNIISGFEKLLSIGESVNISRNKNLIGIVGFNDLASINGNLTITFNNKLKSIGGLQNIDPNTIKKLNLYKNPQLSYCCVKTLIDLFQLPDRKVEIHDNDEMCNNESKIISSWNLLPSCYSKELEIIYQGEIDYFKNFYHGCTEIDGDLYIGDHSYPYYNTSISNLYGLTNISKVKGKLKISKNPSLKNLKGLENITSPFFENSISIGDNDSLNSLAGLDNLDSIVGSLSIFYNDNLLDLSSLSSLKSIRGNLYLEGDKKTKLSSFHGLENLKDIGDNLIIRNLKIKNFKGFSSLKKISHDMIVKDNAALLNFEGIEKLKYIGKDLIIENNDSLIDLNGLNNLDSLGGNFELKENNSIFYIHGLEKINSIGGSLIIKENESLVGLNGLNYLDSITGHLNISKNNSLRNIFDLDNLSFLGGSLIIGSNFSLDKVFNSTKLRAIGGDLSIFKNSSLKTLMSLNKITSINGYLSIIDNDIIKTLDGLHNIKSIDGGLSITKNDELDNINALGNINPNTIASKYTSSYSKDLKIEYNRKLSNCKVKNICQVLSRPNVKKSIRSNANGCKNADEISCPNYDLISGTVFYDFNQNKLLDNNEIGISGKKILFNPPNKEFLSDQNGHFYQLGDTGVVYSFSLLDDPDWILTTDSFSYNVLFIPESPIISNKNFGIIPSFTKHEGQINLSSNQTRCNTDVKFFLHFQNTGTFKESGQIELHYDTSSTFISAIPKPHVIDETTHTLHWNFNNLLPYQFKDIKIYLKMPDQNSTGEGINFNAKMIGDSMGMPVILGEFTYFQIIRCSYDPNDKLVSPVGKNTESFTLRDETLTYTIRFQNTGNAKAINIKILDTLDTNLDMNTFHVINSSFPVKTIVDGHNIEFLFRQILLPDSTSNEPASHGFITYEIKSNKGLNDFTKIENKAYIVFDFNPAIITNSTINTMVTKIPLSIGSREEKMKLLVYPNPASNTVFIDFNNTKISNAKISILDYAGKEQISLQKIDTNKMISLNTKSLISGLYFIKIKLKDKVIYRRLVID